MSTVEGILISALTLFIRNNSWPYLAAEHVDIERLQLAVHMRKELLDKMVPPECSICRQRHGREIEHACE